MWNHLRHRVLISLIFFPWLTHRFDIFHRNRYLVLSRFVCWLMKHCSSRRWQTPVYATAWELYLHPDGYGGTRKAFGPTAISTFQFLKCPFIWNYYSTHDVDNVGVDDVSQRANSTDLEWNVSNRLWESRVSIGTAVGLRLSVHVLLNTNEDNTASGGFQWSLLLGV